MRVAILSDIHGNLTALEAVLADLKSMRPDLVVHGGDLALGGCRPAEVVDRVRESGWPGVLGNTDEVHWNQNARADLEQRAPKLRNLFHVIFDLQVPATTQMLGGERIAWMRKLPTVWRSPDASIAAVHASPDNVWRSPGPEAEEAELRLTYGPLDCSIAVYGHIHRPYVRALPGITIANSGSVGMPYDGDPRASYLLIEDGRVTIHRVEYDVEGEIGELMSSNYPNAASIAETMRKGAYVAPSG
jgi:predicted phosphodiesterase